MMVMIMLMMTMMITTMALNLPLVLWHLSTLTAGIRYTGNHTDGDSPWQLPQTLKTTPFLILTPGVVLWVLFFCFLFCRFFVSPLPLSHLCPALWLIVYTFCLWWHRRCSSSLKGVSPSPIFALSHRGVSPYYLSTKRYTGCFFKLFLPKNEVLDP